MLKIIPIRSDHNFLMTKISLLDLRTLREEKAKLLQQRSIPPAYLKADLKTFDLSRLGMEFDVIYIDPPLDLYEPVEFIVATS